ncbi:MAG: hypothetical protein QNJ38_23215 [Prochloraceae cyanobacterium]|nr:hypothetical protein [Prochloraceae cyanobacterium]
MSEQTRPLSIKILCIIGFIGIGLSALGILFGIAQYEMMAEALAEQGASSWYVENFVAIGIFFSIVGLISYLGLWQMKKWGAYTYFGMTTASQIITIEAGIWQIFSLILPAIIIFFAFKNLSKMT